MLFFVGFRLPGGHRWHGPLKHFNLLGHFHFTGCRILVEGLKTNLALDHLVSYRRDDRHVNRRRRFHGRAFSGEARDDRHLIFHLLLDASQLSFQDLYPL